ncbi:MAG: hypothetical protein Q8O99_01355 [bacterium]|nr:hypothetical protein [bacterium]
MHKKFKQFLIEIFPLSIAFFLQPFIHTELQFTIIVALILLISLKIKYYAEDLLTKK